MDRRTGGCQCRAVRYTLTSEPLALLACHCMNCQSQSGGSFALTLWVPRDGGIQLSAGADEHLCRFAIDTASGRPKAGVFCRQCGVRLWHDADGSATLSLKPGTLDDTSDIAPTCHIWTQRAQPWLRQMLESQDVRCYDGEAPNSELLEQWAAK